MKIADIELEDDAFPAHLGIIMDGNGRWARSRGKSANYGHRAGMQTLKKMLKLIDKTSISTITLFVFSRENWKRSDEELRGLFDLLREFYRTEYRKIKERQVRILHSGTYDGLDADITGILDTMVSETAANTGKVLNLAINYSGRDEITRAVRRIAGLDIDPASITEKLVYEHLDHPELGEMDLLIRTSGELRISNFFLWQLAYTELFFSDVYWPDFDEKSFAAAILAYQNRERRFGGRLDIGKAKGEDCA